MRSRLAQPLPPRNRKQDNAQQRSRLNALMRHTAASCFPSMELTDPKIDFVGLARSLRIKADRARTVHEATDLLATALKNARPMLIDVELDRAFKPM